MNCVNRYFYWFMFLFPNCKNVIVNGASATDITRLRSEILENYDPQARPVQDNKDTIEVYIAFYQNGFEFDDQRDVMTLNLFTYMVWEDKHIKWDPLSYGNLSEIIFSATELWKPDISLINNYDTSEIDHFSNALMIGQPDSMVWWMPPTKFQVLCPSSGYRLWPYDKHKCHFQISTWSHHGGEVNITVGENYTSLMVEKEWEELEQNLRNREWKLINNSVERISVEYCCPEVEDIDILITVEIQRRALAHTAAITIVGLGVSAAILVSFWLDPFSNERLPLTLLVMLLNSIYLQFLYKAAPKYGVPLAIGFFRDSLVMVSFALTWTIAIRYIAKTKRNSPVPLPNFIESLLNSYVATILCLNSRPESRSQRQKNADNVGEGDVSELVAENAESDYIQQDWLWMARLLDRISFLFYLVTYITFIVAFL